MLSVVMALGLGSVLMKQVPLTADASVIQQCADLAGDAAFNSTETHTIQ